MSGPAFGDSVARSFVGAWQSHAVANPSHFEPMRRELNTDRLLLRP
jgi:hypothetical protein